MMQRTAMPDTALSSPPLTVGACATLACIWEATAAKPGNVYRGADFEDVTFADFLTSAAVIGPILEKTNQLGVGKTVLQAVQATQAAVASNTNLGMLLLMTPLAAVADNQPLNAGISQILTNLTTTDTQAVYAAIAAANPGGLGEVDEADVQSNELPQIELVEAMRLAADRDLVARQYVNNFQQVFQSAERIELGCQQGWPLGEAIVHTFLHSLSEHSDSLIIRKCGLELGAEVKQRAARVLGTGQPGETAYFRAVEDFDFWLRADGHRRNPGTSADIIAAGLFVLLREQRPRWPAKFYRDESENPQN